MRKRLILSLLVVVLMLVPLFVVACDGGDGTDGGTTDGGTTDGGTTDGGTTDGGTTDGGDWWDVFGEPQYGDSITIATTLDDVPLDPWSGKGYTPGLGFQFTNEGLFWWDWTLDRDLWPYQADFIPEEYLSGHLAESWEMTDPTTFTVTIRQGVYWQDLEPVNGREFVAADVAEHYHRLMGTDGYTEVNPFAESWLSAVESVTATDTYTVVFVFKENQALTGLFQIMDLAGQNTIECPESVTASGGVITEWQYCVGTGPFIMSDFQGGTSVTYTANPNYWGYDERYPENQLPYVDEVTLLNIVETATQLAALRTGQIDILNQNCALGGLSWQQAEALAGTNSELIQVQMATDNYSLLLAADTAPFTDLRVRQAMQLAMNLPELAETYFGGTVDGTPCGMVSPSYVGWCYAYDEWSQELKDEYSYNPDLAMDLLAEAAADGVFEPNDLGGFDATIVTGSANDLQLLQVMQSYLLDIGVSTEIETHDPAAVFLYCMEGNNDGFFYASQTGVSWPVSIMITARMSTDVRNFTRCNDPEYDAIAARFLSASTMDEAKEALHDADKRILEQHWTVYLFPSYIYGAYQPYLMGYSGETLGYQQAQVWARLWIDQELKASMGR